MDELEDDTVSVASTEPVEPCWPFWGLLVRTERVEIRQPGTLREIILMKYPRPDFFNRFRSIGERSLGMLGRRTLQEIRSAAIEMQAEIDAWKDQYIEQETDNYIRRLSEHGGWELGYLPSDSRGTESEIRYLIENWSSEWDDSPSLPSKDDVSDFDALRDMYQYEPEEFFYLGLVEPDEYEFYAVLALMKICEAAHSNLPSESVSYQSRFTPTAVQVMAIGNATIEAIEALDYAERMQLEARIRKAVASEQPAILAAALADRVSERASKAALKRHSMSDPARNFVLKEWRTNRASYQDNKSAFTRDYVRRVLNEFDVTVTEKTMREVWLRDNLNASKQT